MLKKFLYKFISNKSKNNVNTDKTMVYASHASVLFIISLGMSITAFYLANISARESMLSTKVVITFAFIIGAINVFIRFLDIVFEAIKYDYDKRASL